MDRIFLHLEIKGGVVLTADKVKEMLSTHDILSLLEEFGAEPKESGNIIIAKTICHNAPHAGKHKLYYYPNKKLFHCYTECGTFDVFGLIGKILNLDFYGSYKYICLKFGISLYDENYQSGDYVDISFFKDFYKEKETINLTIYPSNILNTYYDLYHRAWIDEGISIETMKKFNIKFCIGNNQIIIPHYNIDGKLVGVRARNLNPELVEEGKKYIPVYCKGQLLNHPTGANLFGLNITRKQIEKYHTAILFEAEKSVMQLETMLPDMSIGVCVSGSNLTTYQLEILKQLDIKEVIIALDKEFTEVGSNEEKFYAEKIQSGFINKLLPYFQCSIIWDCNNLLDYKNSPTDKGIEVFQELFKKRIYV
jgi:hypothetical protein